ncbi:hypothetical protein [Snodgrassella sp. ESL0253]|uniref:hypothetical protein n=1 Tax=Snodgrassella sp. ESL0253 TaxID=2705031 RepID=UPI001583AA9A|nr:hypothetical protein [Snodgrassella sp. ESL0253]NUE67609.1 hypothetical protein [Snodgrassella sp. ESL0253]
MSRFSPSTLPDSVNAESYLDAAGAGTTALSPAGFTQVVIWPDFTVIPEASSLRTALFVSVGTDLDMLRDE